MKEIGTWKTEEAGKYIRIECAVCGKGYSIGKATWAEDDYNYCPKCGSIMIKRNEVSE